VFILANRAVRAEIFIKRSHGAI